MANDVIGLLDWEKERAMRLFISLSLVGCMSLVSVAARANSETFSPGLCATQLNGTIGSTNYYTVPYQNSVSAFANGSTGNMYVTCPIVRTDTENTNGLDFAVMYIYNPSGKTTTCTFWSRDIFGNSLSGNSYNSESTSTAGQQALYFSPYPSVSSEWGTYGISCTLPAGGAIDSYTIFEN